ncbi:hypothetical protein RUM44_008443 [Polyplax serrata]|uniref:Uncharacterized protein n=1 Tax=Polyplax serrata TaxID=468196 RepID=A0ABR1BA64_POLSC
MAVHGTDLNTVQVRLRNSVFIRPMQRRIVELTNILGECNTKDLQVFFPFLVEHIFGVNPSYGPGWNLLRTSRRHDVGDFEALYKFLHPFGMFFEIIYKLLGDVYLKYEYPLTFLPSKLRQAILEGSVPQFYLDKLQIDPHLREPVGLLLSILLLTIYYNLTINCTNR